MQKEQEAAGRGFSDLIPTKGQYRLRVRWANGRCWKHARLAGYSSKETLFSNVGMMEKGHRQKKLPFITVLEKKKSQSQMALNEETSSEGSTELPLENPSEAIPPMDVQSISEIDTVLDVHSLCEASDIGIMEDASLLEEKNPFGQVIELNQQDEERPLQCATCDQGGVMIAE